MTREHKLALILGFALVLVVGVLVSDHISGSQRAVASTQSMDDPVRAIESELGPGLGIVSYRREDRIMPGLRAPSDAERSSLGDDGPGGIGSVVQAVQEEIDRIATSPPPVAGGVVLTPNQPSVVVMGKGQQGSEVPVTRAVDTHRVEKGETLWSIAEKYYGDGGLSRKLAAWNSGRVGSGGVIRPGASLVIPSRAELDGVAVVLAGTPNHSADPIRPEREPIAAARVYVVKKGDVLSTISQRELGTVKRMGEILRLNGDKIDTADEIWVGLELKMPAR